jgi:hypothetical protein
MYLRLILFFVLFSSQAFAITTPNVSANTLFLYRQSNFHKEDQNVTSPDQNPNGLDLREAELQFYSDVDPYTRLNVLMSIGSEYTTDGVTVSQSWGIEPEEVFAEANAVDGVTFKIGKFRAAMGKHNTLHTHAFTFIEAPLANNALLGGETLNDSGVSAAILIPTTWFNEFTIQYLRGQGENDEFNSPSPASGVGLVHWKNLFDMTDELTMELGLSYARGNNSFKDQTTLSGADLTFKWKPSVGGKYASWIWATEYLKRTQAQPGITNDTGIGLASWIEYQFAERWSVDYRYDNLIEVATTERHSLGFNFKPSEFASYKLEYNQTRGPLLNADNNNVEKTIFLQANFTIGAHPAHTY